MIPQWSWHIFFAKITSRKFWVWAVTTAIAYALLKNDGDHAFLVPVVIVWGATTLIYLTGETIVDALGKAIEKAQITLGIGK
jgi:hypothetical protein